MGRVLRNRAVLAVSLGHLMVDVLSNSLPLLLVVIAAQLKLSNVGLGTAATLYMLSASLAQPLFGLVTDRWNSRWLIVGAMIWQAAGFALAATLPGYLSLAAFVVAGLGSAAFHPQGALNARQAAGDDAASGTSIFFFFGMTGQALGPALAGLLLARLPLSLTILILTSLVVPAAVLLARFAPHGTAPRATAASSAHGVATIRWTPLGLAAFVLVLFLSGWPIAATSTFLAKWLADAGFSTGSSGTLLSSFLIASAFGNVFGGWLADRWSRKGVVVVSLALSALPFYALYAAPSTGVAALAVAAIAGFVIRMPHSVLILLGQNLLPGRMGFASGLVLGFFFCVSALAAWLTGWLGDLIGLHQSLLLLPWIAFLGACCALLLPRTRPQSQPQPAPSLVPTERRG